MLPKYLKNLKYNVGDFWYYLKCKLWHKFNTVTAKNLPPTWTDRDNLLIHITFQIVCDFVEKELENENPFSSDSEDEESKKSILTWRSATQELIDMRDWYINVYVPWYNSDGSYETENYMREVVKLKMKRVVDLMGYMWT